MAYTLVFLRDSRHPGNQAVAEAIWDGTTADKQRIAAWRMRWNKRQAGRYVLDYTGRQVRMVRDGAAVTWEYVYEGDATDA